MNCQRRILGIRWFHFVTNASVTSQTGEEDRASRIRRRRLSVIGHVRRLPESDTSPLCASPGRGHSSRLQTDTATTDRSGNADEDDPAERGCSRRHWAYERSTTLTFHKPTNDAWRIAHDRKSWRALRPRSFSFFLTPRADTQFQGGTPTAGA